MTHATLATMAKLMAPAPVRAIGWFSLTAIAVNGMVGAGILILPANVALLLGGNSPLAYLLAGGAVILVALCFAEAGSLFEGSGGPYLYAREAFGRFAGFQIGVLLTLSRVAGAAALSNAFSAYAGYLWPALGVGWGRGFAITLVFVVLTLVNYLGIRPGVWSINLLTVGKLLPLLVFCAVGLFHLGARPPAAPLAAVSLQQAALLLIYAFGGFEFASIPSEEVIEPRRTLPVVILASVGSVVVLYLVIQFVAMRTLPGLAASPAPLAQAARSFLGPAGGVLLAVGAVLSTTGTNSASILIGSRMLYALGRSGDLPAALARLHPLYRTPAVSTLLFAAVAWMAALLGNFGELAALGALSRVLYYTATCAAVPVLRRKKVGAMRSFTLPGGWIVPALALGVCGWLLAGSTLRQALITGAAMLAGTVLYGVSAVTRKSRAV
jgi:basic amino acid/polyamine antiporter, APA family